MTIEAGAQYALNDVGNDYAVQDLIDGEYVVDPDLTNDFRYDQKVLGVYGTAAYEGKKSGIKLGLRMENTDLKTLLATTNERNDRTFTDLFPSAHATHKISEFFSLAGRLFPQDLEAGAVGPQPLLQHHQQLQHPHRQPGPAA